MNSSFINNIRAGLFWIGMFKMFGQLFIWVNTIIIARFLLPADYGLVGMVSLITGFILLIGNFGFGSSIVQKKELSDIHINTLFLITIGIGFIFYIFLYIIAPVVASFFKNQEVEKILRLSAIGVFFTIISDIPNSLLLRKFRYKITGLVDFISNLSASISVLIFAFNGFGVYSLVFGMIITGFMTFSLACYFGKWLPVFKFGFKNIGGFFKFGGTIVADRMLWYLYSNSDYIILAKKLGEISFGLYSFAFNLACIPTNKLQPIIYPVLFSSFSKIQDDLPQVRKQYLTIVKMAFVLYAMIYCGIFWICPEFISIFLGSKWEPIISVLQILLIIQPLRSVSALSSPLINAIGRPDIGVYNMGIFTVIMVPSFYLGSFWGITGVAYMWCLIYPIAFIITLLRILKVSCISLKSYLIQFLPGLKLVFFTSLFIYFFKMAIHHFFFFTLTTKIWFLFSGSIVVGVLSNLAVLWCFENKTFYSLLNFIKQNNS